MILGWNNRPSNTLIVPSIPISIPPSVGEIPKIIKAVNTSNATIHSFACEDITIRTWNNAIRNKAQGKIYYQPAKNFRFYVQSIMGLELDLGSNDTIFWFWSKRNKEPGLFYARYEDYTKTRLKTPFNPMWLRGSLGLDPISVAKSQFSETDKDFIVVQEDLSASGEQTFVYIFVDKSMQKIRGFALTDCQNNLLASSEITYSGNLPSKIYYSWYEEDRYMEIQFTNPSINVALNEKFWEMPSFTPQINMGKN
jgi:hypothetical protein